MMRSTYNSNNDKQRLLRDFINNPRREQLLKYMDYLHGKYTSPSATVYKGSLEFGVKWVNEWAQEQYEQCQLELDRILEDYKNRINNL